MKKQIPRGIRNRNPLNIKWNPKNKWAGLVENEKRRDKVFCEFKDMAYGFRAAGKLLRKYIKDYKWNTIRKIIDHWAPSSENDTKAYASRVSLRMNKPMDVVLDYNDTNTMIELMSAMCVQENGAMYDPDWDDNLTMALIIGWDMAKDNKRTL